MMSITVRPLQNLPLGPVGKSKPLYRKLAFDSVAMKLLFPGSIRESPKANIAGGKFGLHVKLCAFV